MTSPRPISINSCIIFIRFPNALPPIFLFIPLFLPPPPPHLSSPVKYNLLSSQLSMSTAMDKAIETETVRTGRGFLIGELTRGRDSAKQLKGLLRNSLPTDGSDSVDELVARIIKSFSDSLSFLSTCESPELCQILLADDDGYSVDCKDSGNTRKVAGKNRRGCYKRRKTSDSRVVLSPTTEDGCAWRKYGQKAILNSKHPRCYFRCTHKYDQGCKATKQVQRLEDGSNLYHITYFGNHTCKSLLKGTHLFTDEEDPRIINFQSIPPPEKGKTSPRCPSRAKQESRAQSEISSDVSSSRPALWREIVALEPFEAAGVAGFGHEYAVSGVHDSRGSPSSGDLDIGILMEYDSFNGDFRFEETDFS